MHLDTKATELNHQRLRAKAAVHLVHPMFLLPVFLWRVEDWKADPCERKPTQNRQAIDVHETSRAGHDRQWDTHTHTHTHTHTEHAKNITELFRIVELDFQSRIISVTHSGAEQ